MTKNKQLILTVIYVAIIASISARFADLFSLGGIKNIRFIAPLILLPLLFSKPVDGYNESVKPFFGSLYRTFIFVIVYTLFVSFIIFDLGFTYRNFVNLILLLTPLIISDAISKKTSLLQHRKVIYFLFWSYVFVFFVQLAKDGISLVSILTIFQSNIIVDSEFETESDVSLVLGPYALFFLHYKRWKYAAFSIFLVILGAKRVAILGLAISILFYYVICPVIFRKQTEERPSKKFAIIFSVCGILVASIWAMIIEGTFSDYIQEVTGLSINRFLMGRMGRFQLVFSNIHEHPFPGFGYGLGYIENILYYVANFPSSFHNDFYRLYLEFGVIVFGIWLYIQGYFCTSNKLLFSLIILIFLLMQTDNVFMYDRVMYAFYLIYAFNRKEYLANQMEETENMEEEYMEGVSQI